MSSNTHEKKQEGCPSCPNYSTHRFIAAGSNESEAAVVELAAIHTAVSSVAGVADGVRVGETTTIAVV